MFLDLTQLRRADQRVTVFFRESRGHQDINIDLFDHAGEGIGVSTLQNLDALCGESALLAESQDINARACCNRGQEQFKRGWRTRYGRLVGGDGEISEMGIHAGAAGEVNKNFHEYSSF